MKSRQIRLASRVLVKVLMEWRTIIVFDVAHMLVFRVMAFVA